MKDFGAMTNLELWYGRLRVDDVVERAAGEAVASGRVVAESDL
jgi:hypothetical protein